MPAVEVIGLGKWFHEDPKTGWSAYPFARSVDSSTTDIRGAHVVGIKPGQVRGNHYHEKTDEYLFFFSGKGELYYEETGGAGKGGGETKVLALEGAPTLVRIEAGVRHAFKNTGDADVLLLAVREGEADFENPDVVRSALIGP